MFEQFSGKQVFMESVTSYIGTGSPRFYLLLDQVLPQTNVSQLVILPNNLEAWEALRLKIIAAFKNDFPEVRARVKLLPNGPPVPYPVQFRVTGDEVGKVRANADQVKEVMRANPNAIGVNDNWNESVKVLRLDLDQDKLQALGIGWQTVMRAADTNLSGTTIGQYRANNKLIDIVIRQPVEERATIAALNEANIQTPSGRSIPLSQLAQARFVWEPRVVWREGREWAIYVQADVADGIQGAAVSSKIEPKLAGFRATLPAGHKIELAGAAADSSKAQASIAANVPLVIFIIFALLMMQLHSFPRAVLVFLTRPLGVVGAAFALLLRHRPFGFIAQLGVIALYGVVIRNSVILIDQIEQDIAGGAAP